MRMILALLAAVAAMPALAEGIEVHNAFARIARPGGPTGAVFMELRNTSDSADRLLAATSPVAELVQLHTHIDDQGVMRMRQIEDGIPLPPDATHSLARGGDHIMLMGLTDTFQNGQTIPLTLIFETSGKIALSVPIDNQRGQGH